MPSTITEFKAISYGIVAEHKVRDTLFNEGGVIQKDEAGDVMPHAGKMVEVIPMEWLPNATCTVTKETETLTVQGLDKNGNEYSLSVQQSFCVPAQWLQDGTNRITAPDVRVGERVMLWQYAGSDAYWWTTMGKDDNLRKLETVVYGISATMDETDVGLNATNTYYLSLSSHDKKVTLSTSQANGEPYGYILQLDTDLGNMSLRDTDDNYILFDSMNTTVTIENREGTRLDLTLKDMIAYANNQIRTTSMDESIFTSKKLMSLICPEGIIGDSGLEPAVLGDKLSAFLVALCDKLDQHKHIGNLGAPTSPMMAVAPLALQSHYTKTSGSIFSKKLQHF